MSLCSDGASGRSKQRPHTGGPRPEVDHEDLGDVNGPEGVEAMNGVEAVEAMNVVEGAEA